MTDTELLNWLEQHAVGFGVVSDDNGRWAVPEDGIQPCCPEPRDMELVFFVEKSRWKNSIREAIEHAAKEAKR
jgi:hypothetical protein